MPPRYRVTIKDGRGFLFLLCCRRRTDSRYWILFFRPAIESLSNYCRTAVVSLLPLFAYSAKRLIHGKIDEEVIGGGQGQPFICAGTNLTP